MGAAVGLMLGLGLVTLVSAFGASTVQPRSAGRARRGRTPLVARAGLGRFGRLDVLVAVLGLGVGAGLVVQVLTGSAAVSVAAAVVLAGASHAWLVRRAAQRTRRAAAAWPDTIDLVATSLRAGLSLAEALARLQSRSPTSLRPELDRVARDVRATGRPVQVLAAWGERADDPVTRRAVAAMAEVGESAAAADLLAEVAVRLREDLRLRAMIESRRRAVGVLAQAAFVVPVVLLAGLAWDGSGLAEFDALEDAAVLVGCVLLATLGHRAVAVWETAPLDDGGPA